MNDFRLLVKILRHAFPDYKVYVRRVPMSNKHGGDCQKIKKDTFLIRINKNCEHQESLNFLLHEWSHVLSYDSEEDHGVAFGKAYAKVYNIYLEKFCNADSQN